MEAQWPNGSVVLDLRLNSPASSPCQGLTLLSQCPSPSAQGPVVQRLDNAIRLINHYPVDSVVYFANTYPLDSDLSI